MLKITILTLFPSSIEWIKQYSIIARAIAKQYVELEVLDFREYSTNKHKSVDDTQYGGGAGMVIALPAIVKCLEEIRTQYSLVYLLSPIGQCFNQKMAKTLATSAKHIVLICGHYEGIDHRIMKYIDDCISIGDYILTGGEIPALVVIDSVIRLLDGVINSESLETESFEQELLDYPVYTRPFEFDSQAVPTVLLSGNHEQIRNWRWQQRLALTRKYRPDLYKKYTSKK